MTPKRSSSRRRSRRRHSRPARLTIFLDANIDGRAASALVEAMGLGFERCRDHFPEETADEVIIPFVAEKGWIFISKDRAIGKDREQREILKRTSARAFLFGRADMTKEQIVAALRLALPRVGQLLKKKARRGKGIIRRITSGGELAELP